MFTYESDVVPPGSGVGNTGAHGDHDEKEGDEEPDPVVALVDLNVERRKRTECKETQRNVAN